MDRDGGEVDLELIEWTYRRSIESARTPAAVAAIRAAIASEQEQGIWPRAGTRAERVERLLEVAERRAGRPDAPPPGARELIERCHGARSGAELDQVAAWLEQARRDARARIGVRRRRWVLEALRAARRRLGCEPRG